MKNSKVVVVDLDGTLCQEKEEGQTYLEVEPREKVLERLQEYKSDGFYIIINTSRNMRTHDRNIGLINADTLKTIHKWLEKYNVPFDEIQVGRPWCGREGFYVDDKTVSPEEFVSKDYQEIKDYLGLNE